MNELKYFMMDNGVWIVGKVTNVNVDGHNEVFLIESPMTVAHFVSPEGQIGFTFMPMVPGDEKAAVEMYHNAIAGYCHEIPDAVERKYLELTTNIQLAH